MLTHKVTVAKVIRFITISAFFFQKWYIFTILFLYRSFSLKKNIGSRFFFRHFSFSAYPDNSFFVGNFAGFGFDDLFSIILCNKNNCFVNFGTILGSAFLQFYAEKCIIFDHRYVFCQFYAEKCSIFEFRAGTRRLFLTK